MHTRTFTTELAGKTLTAEFTDLTPHTNGSVLVRYGETVILVTAVMGPEQPQLGYFPLSVEFEEKFYAAGQILGSRFIRREGRPSEEAILSARIVDRTIRPLFPPQLRASVQVVVTVLALGDDDPDVLGVIGASLALATSDIPWNGPVGAVRIGRKRGGGAVLINPTYPERAEELLDFEVLTCGHRGTINMIETAAREVSEDDLIAILEAAIQVHASLETFTHEIISALGRPKQESSVPELPAGVSDLFNAEYAAALTNTLFSGRPGKGKISALRDTFVAAARALPDAPDAHQLIAYFEEAVDETLRRGVLDEGRRPDGRAFDEVRALFAQAGGISPVLHGAGIFYRGETHILTALTLGGPDAAQMIDTIEEHEVKKRFMHHYNFPPFSVGETGRVGGFSRRAIGHGALAEKALAPVIPDTDTFPYTIRLVSETLSSNGSSSMGSVCAATLALMDGGVPIIRPVAGIASGLITDGERFQLLTDIQGPEDEYGDMDLKVAGTERGITAVQMDVKVDGVSIDVLGEALERARVARLLILGAMEKAIAVPRATISPRAPEIRTLTIDPEQIGRVIGSGGKTINGIKEESGVEEINIEDDGTIFITGRHGSAERALAMITALTREYVVGEHVRAIVTRLVNFGAFAKLDEHHEGLIHISEVAPFRVEKLDAVLTVGEEVPVEIIKVENDRIGLSIKQADPEFAIRKGVNAPDTPRSGKSASVSGAGPAPGNEQ